MKLPVSWRLRDVVEFRVGGGVEEWCRELERAVKDGGEARRLLASLVRVCVADEDSVVEVVSFWSTLVLAAEQEENAELAYEVLGLCGSARSSLYRRPAPEKIEVDGDELWIRAVPTRQAAQRDTGFMVWPTAKILARYLRRERMAFEGRVILELGAGVGLSGIACAAFAESVILTDSNDDCLKALRYNARLNDAEGEEKITVEHLDFARLAEKTRRYDRVVASDVVCCDRDALALATAIDLLLSKKGGLAVVAQPNARHRYGVDTFVAALAENGLVFEATSTNDDPNLVLGLGDETNYFEWFIYSITRKGQKREF